MRKILYLKSAYNNYHQQYTPLLLYITDYKISLLKTSFI